MRHLARSFAPELLRFSFFVVAAVVLTAGVLRLR